MGKVPVDVGVPLRTPVEGARDRPGTLPVMIVHVNGPVPPVSVRVVEGYAVFTVPVGNVVVVIAKVVTVMLSACVAVSPIVSVTCTVNG
jgi:hypothetical protein